MDSRSETPGTKTSPISSTDKLTIHWLSPGTFGLGHCVRFLTNNPSLLELGAVYVNEERAVNERRVLPGDYLRVHTRPRRYPACRCVWADRILSTTPNFIVVNKPPGVPVHATLDNAYENAKVCVEIELGVPLFMTSRIDVETQGLVVFAKTSSFVTQHNKRLARGQVEKNYRALASQPPPLGKIRHWMRPSDRAPRELCDTFEEGWPLCELEVTSVERSGDAWLLSIRLLTGRTHQIRAQLSRVGCPLLNDSLYGGPKAPINGIGLQASRLEWEDVTFQLPPPDDWA